MEEIRGVWIANRPHSEVLSSRENIVEAMDFLAEMGFNAVFPVVWNQGFTLFRSQVMLDNGFEEIDNFFAVQSRDPLKELIKEAHDRNIVVIPWFEYGFACSARADGGHILTQKPQWAAHAQNGTLLKDGRLIWMNALDRQVQDFMQDLVLEVAKNYEVDGIQGDDRLPAFPSKGGYDPGTKSLYHAEFSVNPPNDTQDSEWIKWRANILTQFMARLHSAVKAVNPKLVVAMSPNPYPWCLNNYLQDTKAWVTQRLVDIVSPQLYRETLEKYENEVSNINHYFSNDLAKFVPGIAFRANNTDISPDDLKKYITTNRQRGLGGQVFFHYEGLKRNVTGGTMAQVLKQGPYSQVASLPSSFA
jgi:uncharacterized lipoprotein YddW (UPF0748 family)